MARQFVTLDEGGRLTGGRDRLANPTPIMQALGALALAQAQRAFRDQKKGRFRWPARQVPNLAGILSDLQAGRPVRGRRFTPRPALVDTGRLRASLSFRVVGGQTVEVGTTLPYAGLHQEGGTVTVPITPAIRERVPALVRDRPELAEFLEQLVERDSVSINVRRRPFVLVSGADRRELLAEASRLVREGFGGGR